MHTRTRTRAAALAIIIGLLALPAAAWNVDIEVLRHGRTPLDAVDPTATITSGEVSRTFATRPARASRSRAGTWRTSARR